MIDISIIRQVNNGTAPYSFLFYDANDTGCVSFSPESGTSTDGTIQTTATFTNSACIENASLKLAVTDADGCTNTWDVDPSDPCDSFDVQGVFNNPPFTYSVVPSGGSGSYFVNWIFDDSLFAFDPNNTGQNGTTIDLIYVGSGTTPASTPITAIVDDGSGCSTTVVYQFPFCKPNVDNLAVDLICDTSTGVSQHLAVLLPVTPCSGIDIDWTTLSFTTPAGITVTHPYITDPTQPSNLIEIVTQPNYPVGTYNITYYVEDELGQISDLAIIEATTSSCSEPQPVTLPNHTIQIDCTLIAGDDFEIDMSGLPVPEVNADWSTFAFVPGGGVIATTPEGTANGYPNNAVFTEALKTVTYTVPITSGADYFQWELNDINGNLSNIGIVTIWLDCPEAPVAVADTSCAACGEQQTINILANDTIGGIYSIDPSSIQITEAPSNGIAFVDTAGNLFYTPNPGYAGTDTINYIVGNNASPIQYSNEVTVTITVVCSGTSAEIAICN